VTQAHTSVPPIAERQPARSKPIETLALEHHCTASDPKRLLIAAEDTLIGGIRAQHDVVIHGQLIGDVAVESGTIRIMSSGRVTGHLSAPRVVVDGQLNGSCRTRQLMVSSGAIVRALIKTTDFCLEPGGIFIGGAEYDSPVPGAAPRATPTPEVQPMPKPVAPQARKRHHSARLAASASVILLCLVLARGYERQTPSVAPVAPAVAPAVAPESAPAPVLTPAAIAQAATPAAAPSPKSLNEGACLLELAQWQTRVLNASLETIQRTHDSQTRQRLNQTISRTATQLRDTRHLLHQYAPRLPLAPYHFREGSSDAANSRAYRRLMQQYTRRIETLSQQANNPGLHPASQRLFAALRPKDAPPSPP